MTDQSRCAELENQLNVLKEKIEIYRSLVEKSHDLFYRTDLEGRITYISPSVKALSGYTMEEAIGMKMAQDVYLVPEERAELLSELWKNGRVDHFQARLKKKDGSVWWASTNAHLVKDEHGNISGVEGVTRDITDLKNAELALKESESRFRLAFHTSPDSLNFSRLEDGMFFDVNDGFTNILGYTREEAVGKTSTELNIWKHRQDRDRLVEGLSEKGFVENLEAEFVHKDGTIRNGLISARMLVLGSENVILSIMRDISDRIRRLEALQQSEERYRSIVENTMIGYFICEIPSGRFVFLNQRICEMFRFRRQEAMMLTFWDLLDPGDHELVRTRIQERLDGEWTNHTSNTYNAVRKDGSKVKAEISTSLITYHGKKMIQGVLRDVTDKHKLVEQLQQAQRMEAIGTLAGGIAHDFNNLLMGIQGRASLMALDMTPGHPHSEHIEGIEEYVRSATDLTRQLLGFARGGKYEVKPVDLSLLVSVSAAMFGRTRKEIRIHTSALRPAMVVDADKRQIEQVLLNLYVNAWQAMPGGGDLYLATECTSLGESYCDSVQIKPGRYVKLSVTDTGIGMSPEVRHRIFDPFFTTKDKGRGTGLGLASAYGIVKNHGGTISVQSEKNRGTTFQIYLPASEKATVPEPADDGEILRGRETVLIVDDEEVMIDVGCAMLEKLGYRVLTARSGAEAVEIVSEPGNDIDLVLLDMIMPGMGGGKAFDRLREIRPGLTVILSSGYTIDGKAMAIMNRGCAGFIQKPFTVSELSLKVRKALDDIHAGSSTDSAH